MVAGNHPVLGSQDVNQRKNAVNDGVHAAFVQRAEKVGRPLDAGGILLERPSTEGNADPAAQRPPLRMAHLTVGELRWSLTRFPGHLS